MTHSAVSHLRSIDDLHSPAGRLEAVLNTGRGDAPYAALVCHPHPLGGGTMHNKVVYHVMKVFTSLGLPVLRFNFRGTGLSEGAFDEGKGEQDDVGAALNWMEVNLDKPILFAGFSFGSHVGLRSCCVDPRVKALICLGLPVHAEGRDYAYGFLRQCLQPKLFISGDHDSYGPRAQVEQVVETATEPKKLIWIEGAEHFFQGIPSSPNSKLSLMQDAIRTWLQEHFDLVQI